MDIVIQVLKAILFGIVEGITEWLPVSSTGHLILLQRFISLDVSEEFFSMFEVVIQLGAIMAVVILYWNKLWFIKKDVYDNKFAININIIRLWLKIIIACIPAAVVGVFFDDWIDSLFYKPLPVAMALIVVGLLFILTEKIIVPRSSVEVKSVYQIPMKDVVIIGIFQLLAAIFPGTSRSGATIVGGLILGLSRKAAAEFTFFLAIPVMLGASLLRGLKFLGKGIPLNGMEIGILVIGTLVAFIVSLIVIKLLMNFIKKHNFISFAYYRIVLGLVIILVEAVAFFGR